MAVNTPLIVSRLAALQDRATFDCGNASLNSYLQTLAGQHERRGIGRTFVVTEHDSVRVLGFYTLAASSVAFEQMPDPEKVPRHPVPVIKLARLAVERARQGGGLGKFLLLDAMARVERISREVAVFAIEVDAIDQTAAAFYKKYGFAVLKDNPSHLYVSLKDISRLRLNS